MLDDHWDEIAHIKSVALYLRLVEEFGGDNDRCRPAQYFESDAVMRTARSARPSVADCRQYNVVISGDYLDQCGIHILGKALLAVVIDGCEGELLLESCDGLAQ